MTLLPSRGRSCAVYLLPCACYRRVLGGDIGRAVQWETLAIVDEDARSEAPLLLRLYYSRA